MSKEVAMSLNCSACLTQKPRAEFGHRQIGLIKKDQKGRCRSCTANKNPVPGLKTKDDRRREYDQVPVKLGCGCEYSKFMFGTMPRYVRSSKR